MSATTLKDRALVRLSGEDVRGFLQGLVTADMNGPLPAWAGLLTPQGKALFDFLLWADGEDVLVDCEAAQAEALVRRLTLYRLRRRIAIARDESLAVHWSPQGPVGVADPRLTGLGHRWLALAGDGDASAAWRAHRLALGVTEGMAELGQDRTLWLETNARELGGVSFTKGCYVGQENTARMHHRSRVSRRLVVLRAASDPGEAANIWYPDSGLAVARLRVEAIRPGPLMLGDVEAVPVIPEWLDAAIAAETAEA